MRLDREKRYQIKALLDAAAQADTVIAAFEPYKEFLSTVTSDNGKEFAGHIRIASELEVGGYFPLPLVGTWSGEYKRSNFSTCQKKRPLRA